MAFSDNSSISATAARWRRRCRLPASPVNGSRRTEGTRKNTPCSIGRVRLSRQLERDAIEAGLVDPWKHTNAKRSAQRKDYRPRHSSHNVEGRGNPMVTLLISAVQPSCPKSSSDIDSLVWPFGPIHGHRVGASLNATPHFAPIAVVSYGGLIDAAEPRRPPLVTEIY